MQLRFEVILKFFVFCIPMMVAPACVTQVPIPSSIANRTPTEFELGIGDQITIRVPDLQEFASETVTIDLDGDIDLPLVGSLRASGATLKELKDELRSKLSKYIQSPEVSINVVANRSSTVSVLGEVNSPGVRQLSGPTSLIEAISAAGGIKPDAGATVIVTRSMKWGSLPLPGETEDATGDFTTASVSLDDLLASKAPANNIAVKPGDIISIPKGAIVYVVGDVHRSGGFPLSSRTSMPLLQALALAEGLGPNASSKSAKILRPIPGGDGKPQEIPIDINKVFSGKEPDAQLYADDILFVPTSAAKSGARRAAEAVLQVATGVVIYR